MSIKARPSRHRALFPFTSPFLCSCLPLARFPFLIHNAPCSAPPRARSAFLVCSQRPSLYSRRATRGEENVPWSSRTSHELAVRTSTVVFTMFTGAGGDQAARARRRRGLTTELSHLLRPSVSSHLLPTRIPRTAAPPFFVNPETQTAAQSKLSCKHRPACLSAGQVSPWPCRPLGGRASCSLVHSI